MSKQKKYWKLRIGLLLLVTVIAILIIVDVVTGILTNKNAEHRIAREYSSVKFPNYLHLMSEKFIGQSLIDPSPGTSQTWNYEYTVTSPDLSAQKVHSDLATSLKRAGFSIDRDLDTNATERINHLSAQKPDLLVDIDLVGGTSDVKTLTAVAYAQ